MILKIFIFIILLIIEFLLIISFILYVISLIISSLMGAPFVMTKKKELDHFLKEADLKPNQSFLELGCGDGRVVRTAVKKYKVKGTGVEINPLLVFFAKIMSRLAGLENIEFVNQNIFNTDLKKADIIYLFLMPKIIKNLIPKFTKELKNNAIIISHAFKIEGWDKYIYKTISHRPFNTYFYRISQV